MPVHPVDKPLGLTSHDVVARARRLLGTRRVGHAGTLDPLATGVLTLLSEESTKLSPYLTSDSKRYLAWVALGAGTPTLDAEGPITERADQNDVEKLTAERIAAAAATFLDVTSQRPPAYSAIKQQGERSYAAARRGELVEPPARPVAYYRVDLLDFQPSRAALPGRFERGPEGWGPAAADAGRTFELPPVLEALPTALLRVEVAAGTYVRSFARDLGAALGVPAHLAGLVRTGAGSIDLADCAPLTELGGTPGLDPLQALGQPKLQLDAATAQAVRQGKRVSLPVTGLTVLVDEAGALTAMVEPLDPPEAEAAGAADGSAPRPIRILRAWQR